ncbi:MAG: hypothetical protein EOO10_06280, partial [Chitinophagaceae bacterium]
YQQVTSFYLDGSSPTLLAARQELMAGLKGLLGKDISETKNQATASLLILSKITS